MTILKNNETVFMSRRYPNLPRKVLYRDSEIVKKIVYAWDIEQDQTKVLDIFLREQKNLSDERYWELLRTVWIIAGAVSVSDIFRGLLTSKRKQRFYFSTPEESKFLRELDFPLDVFRATNDMKDGGLSWTLSFDYANYYQSKFDKKYLMHQCVSKDQVFAYIERNLESEILIL